MTLRSEKKFTSVDGKTQIHVTQWIPENREITGVVQISHGVSEYGRRYEPVAEYLCRQGFAVIANDHHGHGGSLIEDRPAVYLGDKNGWWNTVGDLEKLRISTKKRFPGKPYFMLGHSMGSFLLRSHMIRYPGKADGYILSGTGHLIRPMIFGGKLVADLEIRRLGRTAYSKLADQLVFGAYNKQFQPNRTDSDWLSANAENVDAYLADPLCGGKVTLGLLRDMLGGIDFITRPENIRKMDKQKPVLFISGEKDPVGENGKGVKRAAACFKKAGMEKVKVKLYPGLRHEILNEKEREDILQDMLKWMKSNMEK